MTSSRIPQTCAALALIIGCAATTAWPCSVSPVIDAPHDVGNTYGLHGEVAGYVSMRIPGCEKIADEDLCAPSAGLRIRILEPLNSAARGLTEVEYYTFGTGADCRAFPMPLEQVQLRYPLGARIALAATLFTWDRPKPPRIRLTSLRPIVGEAVFVVPKGVDFDATPFDYAEAIRERRYWLSPETRARINFEIWRDTLRLQSSTSENEALDILLRMAAAVNVMGVYNQDTIYTPAEQLVDRYLPTPAVRAEFERRLKDVYTTANVAK